VAQDLKVVLGRDAAENDRLRAFEAPARWLVEPRGFSGPTALVCGAFSEEALGEAIRLIRRFSKAVPGDRVAWSAGERSGVREVGHLPPAEAATLVQVAATSPRIESVTGSGS
jgi:hypothetical protein